VDSEHHDVDEGVGTEEEVVPSSSRCRSERDGNPLDGRFERRHLVVFGVPQAARPVRLASESLAERMRPCGAYSETFNELAANIPGCMVNGSVCARCASFLN
jgi:hypothetical protein